MKYGITGNTNKEKLWAPAAELVAWLRERALPYALDGPVADGLAARGLLEETECRLHRSDDLPAAVDVLLSFGGDGTLLNTAYQVGPQGTPILGVNIGRLGFLADTEVGQLRETLAQLEDGRYRIESRMVLEAEIHGDDGPEVYWALNDLVLEHSGTARLISVDVQVDGAPLTTYWADGLIISTPTGSTAYSLSVGGPILVPGSGVITLTPIAPHTLTVRPIVLPDTCTIEARMRSQPFVFAADGRSQVMKTTDAVIRMRRAAHKVNLVKLPENDYFQTLRSKLHWGGKNQVI